MAQVVLIFHVVEDASAVGIRSPQFPIVEFEAPIRGRQAQEVGAEGSEGRVFCQVACVDPPGDVHGALRPFDDLVNILHQVVPVLLRESLVHTASDREIPMHALP